MLLANRLGLLTVERVFFVTKSSVIRKWDTDENKSLQKNDDKIKEVYYFFWNCDNIGEASLPFLGDIYDIYVYIYILMFLHLGFYRVYQGFRLT